ncbi:MAG: hypothetical protein Kow00120_25410 [Anaerolineae bacterium]
MLKRTLLLTCLTLLSLGGSLLPPAASQEPTRAARLGVAFISSAQEPITDARYAAGLATGAGWNRWPLYWSVVEPEPEVWDWTPYDRLVVADLQHGLQTEVILIGTPAVRQIETRVGRQTGAVPANLWEPVFTDGTDTPGRDKQINPENYWATYVYRAVRRYMPGGVLGTLRGLGRDQGIRVWEVWNEPDYELFWTGGVEHYVRLLKVAYLAIHHADPEARVMYGGLANHQEVDWLEESLSVIAEDPFHEQYDWYFDILGVHNYTYALGTWEVVDNARQTLNAFGMHKAIWVNESGVPVWDDYPGPTWAADDDRRVLRATMQEQAAFLVQSAAYAFIAGAEVYIWHQLYDDCGNQRGGTDFPPHAGELCEEGFQCWGDAHGLYRNPADANCFRQHPEPNTPRPAFYAFQALAEIFGAHSFTPVSLEHRGADRLETWITFRRPATHERILVVWNRSGAEVDVAIPAVGDRATLYDISGHSGEIRPSEAGEYHLILPPATNRTYPYLPPTEQYAIGGAPYILVERDLAEMPFRATENTGDAPASRRSPRLTP